MTARAAVAIVLLAVGFSGQRAIAQAGSDDWVFVALYERGPAFASGKDVPEQPHFREHVEHLRSRGERIIAGGPFPVSDGDAAVGMVIFQAANRQGAEEWIAKDPGVTAGVFKVTVRQWRVQAIRGFATTPAPEK